MLLNLPGIYDEVTLPLTLTLTQTRTSTLNRTRTLTPTPHQAIILILFAKWLGPKEVMYSAQHFFIQCAAIVRTAIVSIPIVSTALLLTLTPTFTPTFTPAPTRIPASTLALTLTSTPYKVRRPVYEAIHGRAAAARGQGQAQGRLRRGEGRLPTEALERVRSRHRQLGREGGAGGSQMTDDMAVRRRASAFACGDGGGRGWGCLGVARAG